MFYLHKTDLCFVICLNYINIRLNIGHNTYSPNVFFLALLRLFMLMKLLSVIVLLSLLQKQYKVIYTYVPL